MASLLSHIISRPSRTAAARENRPLTDEMLLIDGIGPVRVVQSLRTRRISLTVKPSGAIRLAYAPRIPKRQALAFLEEKRAWILAARERMQQRAGASPVSEPLAPEAVERLRREAQATLPPRVAELAARFGFRYGKVTIRAARTKWGSCTGNNRLSLSLYLMTLPPHLRDFVLLHELCHTVHHDHSPRFHALLDRCTGGCEKALARELRKYHIV